MRELAKSMLGLSWAVSVFGAQQLSRMMTPSQELMDNAVAELNEVSRVVQSHLSDGVAQQFRAVDQWQRRVIDATFTAGAPLQLFDPRPFVQSMRRAIPEGVKRSIDLARMLRSGADIVQRTADGIRQRMPGASPQA